jgi:hypothetical protein
MLVAIVPDKPSVKRSWTTRHHNQLVGLDEKPIDKGILLNETRPILAVGATRASEPLFDELRWVRIISRLS